MSISPNTQTLLRRTFSLSAFAVLIAAVTMAFAKAPGPERAKTFEAKPAAVSAVRLAKAPAKASAKASDDKDSAAKATSSGKAGLQGQLNINTASAEELDKLPGVGPAKAARIIEWRKSHGRFQRVLDLRRVKGFGAKTVKKLTPYLSTSGANTLQ